MACDAGLGLGLGLGEALGLGLGEALGLGLGEALGLGLGEALGLGLGEALGLGLGEALGLGLGEALGLGLGVAPADVTAVQAENSDVSPVDRRVAVAVSFAPTATEAGNVRENAACPALSVVTGVEPRNTAPSPNPDGSQEGLAKNSTVNCAEDEELSVP